MSDVWIWRCSVARVRALALRALVRAGGRPTPAAIRRVLDPVVGDLLGELLGDRDVDQVVAVEGRTAGCDREELF